MFDLERGKDKAEQYSSKSNVNLGRKYSSLL